MKLSYTNTANANGTQSQNGRVSRGQNNVQSGNATHYVPLPNFGALLKQLRAGMSRLYIILKYFLHGMMPNLKGEIKLPWFKIGMIALVLFIVAKKDINFSINTSSAKLNNENIAKTDDQKTPRTDELSLMQAVSFTTKKEPEKQITKENVHYTPTDEEVEIYIKRFTKVAQLEMGKFGIPASVKMSQAILESGAGMSRLAQSEYNHFGRPLVDETYENAWENWRMHSLLLKNDYTNLFNQLGYKDWAIALKDSPYTSDQNYDKKLIEIIEKYQLYLLDEQI